MSLVKLLLVLWFSLNSHTQKYLLKFWYSSLKWAQGWQGLSRRHPAMYYEKIETFIEEDTRNIVHRTMMPQSPSKWAPWALTQFCQSPSAALSYFPESHWQSEISSLSKVILVLGKARSHRTQNLDCRGTESPQWFDVLPKNSAWDVMSEYVVVMKLPVTSCPWLQPFSSYSISQPMKNIEVVLLINYFAWRGVLVMDNTFPIKKDG